MKNRVLTFSLMVLLSVSVSSHADDDESKKVKSVTDNLYSSPYTNFNQSATSPEKFADSCDLDETGLVTIYSVNGRAQVQIDVKLDGNPVGHLTTHFPEGGPDCEAPATEGAISIVVPAGTHTLEAPSVNLIWPGHTFTIEKCECVLLPLS
jgi:hypothetical protein